MPKKPKYVIEPGLLYSQARAGRTHLQIAEAIGCGVATLSIRLRKEPALYSAYRQGYEEAQVEKGATPKPARDHEPCASPYEYEAKLLAEADGQRSWAERAFDSAVRADEHEERLRVLAGRVGLALSSLGAASRRELRDFTGLGYDEINDALDRLRLRGRAERLPDRALIEFYDLTDAGAAWVERRKRRAA